MSLTDEYSASTSLSSYYRSRSERAPARLWSIEKAVHDLAGAGVLNFFEGPGPNPMLLEGASTDKLWLRADHGVTPASGSLRKWNGVSPSTTEANWPLVTPGTFLLHLGNLAPISSVADYPTTLASAAATITSGVAYLRTAGYSTAGDGGASLYKKVGSQPSHAGKFQSIDGAWWEIADPVLYVEQFGAKGDDAADDSAAWTNALSVGRVVHGTFGRTYRVKDLILDGKKVRGNKCRFRPAANARWLWRLTGFEPELTGFGAEDYTDTLVRKTTLSAGVTGGASTFSVSSAASLEKGMLATVLMVNGRWHISPITAVVGSAVTVARAFEADAASGAVVECSWGEINIRNATNEIVADFVMLNTSFGIYKDADVALGSASTRGMLLDGRMSGVKHVGVFVGRDCADSRYLNNFIRGGVTESWNYTSDGVTDTFDLPVAAWLKSDVTITVNGVTLTQGTHYNVTSPTQIQFISGNVPDVGATVVVSNFYDGKAGYVSDATGWASIRGGDFVSTVETLDFIRGIEFHSKELVSLDQITADTCSGEAVYISDICDKITFGDLFAGYSHLPIKIAGNSANIELAGPLWTTIVPESSALVTPSTSAVQVDSGSVLDVDTTSWKRSANKTTSGAGTINYMGAVELRLGSQTEAAAGTTRYYGTDGSTVNSDSNGLLLANPSTLKRLYAECSAAPGSGESYTYTVRVNGVDKLTATIADAAFGAEGLDTIAVSRGSRVDVKLVTSAAATSAKHRAVVVFI